MGLHGLLQGQIYGLTDEQTSVLVKPCVHVCVCVLYICGPVYIGKEKMIYTISEIYCEAI
jgi:hypothetical protein